MLHNVANTLKANNVTALPVRAEAVMAENKAMSKELEELKAKIAASKVDSLFNNAEDADGVKIASAYFTGTTGDTLRGMCDSIRDKAVNPVVAVLVGKAEDKITMAVTVNKLAQEKGLKAGVLVRQGRRQARLRNGWPEGRDQDRRGTGCCGCHRQEGIGRINKAKIRKECFPWKIVCSA